MNRVAIFFLLMSLAFAGLFAADLQGYFNVAQRPVAFLKTSNGTVRRLARNQMTWDRAQGGTLFGAGDTISTGESARAKLVFYAGGELDLDAGAMVILGDDLEELKLNFVSGTGKVRVAKNATSKISVSRGIQVASAKPAVKKPAAAKPVTLPGDRAPTAANAPAAAPATTAALTPAGKVAGSEPAAPTVALPDQNAAQLTELEKQAERDKQAALAKLTEEERQAELKKEGESASRIEVSVVDDLPIAPPPPPDAKVGAVTPQAPVAVAPLKSGAQNSPTKVAADNASPGAKASTETGAAGKKVADAAPGAKSAAESAAPGAKLAAVNAVPGTDTAEGGAAPGTNAGAAPDPALAGTSDDDTVVAQPFALAPAIQEKSIKAAEQALGSGKLAAKGEILNVVKLPPVPEIQFPENDAVIDLSQGKAPKLEWKIPEDDQGGKVKSYEIVLRPADGKGDERVLKTDKPVLSLAQVSRGKYYWSVRAVTAEGKRGPASASRWIEVRQPAQIAKPRILPVQVQVE